VANEKTSRTSRNSGIPAAAASLAALVACFLSTGCEKFIADSHNTDGVHYFQQARYQDAIQEFGQAIYVSPCDADGYYNLGYTYYELGKRDHNPAYFRLAEDNYHKCLDRDGNHTACHRGLAVLLAQQGRKEDAFKLLQGWADRQPTLADPKVELARLYEEYGNHRAAENYLVEAIEAQPEDARALAALGKMREEAGDKAQALANYRRSLDTNGDQPQVASRVAALQGYGGSPVNAGGAPVGPEVEMGTQIANRDDGAKTR
jgi:tetratricopeptide (TPR) repeat protein